MNQVIGFENDAPNTEEREIGESIGIRCWQERRDQWTCVKCKEPGYAYLETSSIKTHLLRPENYVNIYELLINKKKPFSKPINLTHVIGVLKAGWIKDGLWPENYIPKADEPGEVEF